MLIALKETIRRIVRGACRNINWLDGAIALILLLAGLWLASRFHIGVAYQWRWHEAFDLLFTPGPHGELPYFSAVCSLPCASPCSAWCWRCCSALRWG
ncbi:hypothetical protein [Aeromonas sp. 61P]|uniref:hypothetical protein n=1 Tax=Aeromonas sp. 61P TaxID=3452721 RepID=UPI003F7999A2